MVEHDALVEMAVEGAAQLDAREVADAFVASLGARRLDWRSTLGSLAGVQTLEVHSHTPSAEFAGGVCRVCGLPERSRFDRPRLERLRRSQDRLVRFQNVEYAAFDLATFPALGPPPPGTADRQALRAILDGLRALPSTATLKDLDGAARGAFRSNKGQRRYVLEAFGLCGILAPASMAIHRRWIDYDDREGRLRSHHFYARDTAWPLQCWTGADGVNESRVQAWFGHLL